MKNFLMVSIDDFFSLRAWPGYADLVQTPNIDAFAESSSVFSHAFADIALCNPSRTAVLSGQNPWTTGVIDNSLDAFDIIPTEQFLFAQLDTAGYDVTLGGKVFHNNYDEAMDSFAREVFTLDGVRNGPGENSQTFEFIDYGDSGSTPLADDDLARQVIEFLGQEHTAPFALGAGIYRPHQDWVVPQEFYDLYDPAEIHVPFFGDPADEADFYYALTGTEFHKRVIGAEVWVELIHAYLASVSYADHVFGQIITAFEASAYADNTNVVLWSDHGYHLGDSGQWGKFSTWEQSARAPLMIREAGQTTGQVIETVVSLTDIYPTVLELAGAPPVANVTGQSLVPLLEGRPEDFDDHGAITWMYGSLSYRTAEYRYIRNENGSEELYAIETDLHQTKNLIDDPAHQVALEEHRTAIAGVAEEMNIIFGTASDDSLTGSAENDVFILGGGNDTVAGGAGDDFYLLRGTGNIIEELDGGIDTVFVSGSHTLQEGVENLRLYVDSVRYQAQGNDLDNFIATGLGSGTIHGHGGDDSITSMTGDDTIFGGTGNDVLDAGSGNDTIYGQAGDDTVYAGREDDLVLGGTGDDHLDGMGGSDALFGGAGRDTLIGSGGDDMIMGGLDDDMIDTGRGRDTAYGGSGNDFMTTGDRGAATLYGQSGDDVIVSGGGRIEARGGGGHDSITGSAHRDIVYGGSGNDTIDGLTGRDRLEGGAGDDVIRGGSGVAFQAGRSGNDVLEAGEGVAVQSGGADDDRLIAASGSARMHGGDGADSFVFNEAFAGTALVRDFDPLLDRIELAAVYSLPEEDAAAAFTRQAVQDGDNVIVTLTSGEITILSSTVGDVAAQVELI